MKKKIISLALILCLCVTATVTSFNLQEVLAVEDDIYESGGETDEGVDGIAVNKSVTYSHTYDIDGTTILDTDYLLNLEVFTTGTVTSTEETVSPADIVLVLDQSTSMMWPASQAEDNGTDDGNIGIVDGSYSYEYNNEKEKYELTWTQDEFVSVTPLYSEVSRSGNSSTYTATINGNTYTFGQSYNLSVSNWTGAYADEYIEVFGYLYSESRQSDVIEAVVEFIFSLDTTAGHRVSIVTYNSGSEVVYELSDNYLDIVDTVLDWVDSENGANANCDGVKTTYNGSTSTAGVTTFNLGHSTQICYGVEDAESILAIAKYGTENYNNATPLTDDYNNTGRSQVAVIFTDGIPTSGGSSNSTASNVNDALEASYNMKQDNVTVFSIGMLNGVYSDYTAGNTTNNYSSYYYDGTSSGNRYIQNGNTYISAFLDLLSSNYINASTFIANDFPNSSSIYDNDSGNRETITSIFYKATTTDEDGVVSYTQYYHPIDTDTTTDISGTLNSIFEKVAGELSSTATYELDEQTQIRDVMTAEYEIPITYIDTTADASYADNSGDYDLDETTNTYYYVGTGGQYIADVDIDIYISYCTGINESANTTDDTADDYVTEYDSGYYSWGGYYSTDTINDDVTVIVRNVYIDTRKSTEEEDYGKYVYYYDEVELVGEDYYLITDTEHTVPLTASQQVIVEGFNFNNYYVTTEDKSENGTGDYGAKIVIQFEIDSNTVDVGSDSTVVDPSDPTVGGNSIETNTSASGVYIYENVEGSGDYGYSSLASFPVPSADVPIDVNLTVDDQTIYLGNSVSIVDLVKIDGHTIQGVSNKYVDITYILYATEATDEAAYYDYLNYLNDPESYAGSTIPETVLVDTKTSSDGTVTTSYYTYAYDDGGNKIELYSTYIPAGTSAIDATGSYTLDTLITPTEPMNYIVEVTIDPITDGSVDSVTTTSELLRVYVLYPELDVNDVWVDYATPVNLREDNIIQVVDDETGFTYDTVRVTWDTINVYDYDVPEPNEEVPPTVVFGYTARRGIEYTAAEFYELGVREDKEFYISSMTITSSDGYNNITRYDFDDDDTYEDSDYEYTTFNVYVNRFDLEISKTVDADTYDAYPQSFIFDLEYEGSQFTTAQKFMTGVNGFTVFESEDNEMIEIYVDTSGYETEGNSGTYAIYTNTSPSADSPYDESDYVEAYGYYDITELFFTDDSMNVDGSYYIDFTTFTIYYGGVAFNSVPLYDADGDPLYEVVAIDNITKNIEVVVDPDMSTVETIEWTDTDGNRYYTFNVTVTDLYCGLEVTVTEETDWAWRYEPGFTTTTTTQYAEYYNNTQSGELSSLVYVTPSYTYEDAADVDNDYVRRTISIYATDNGTYLVVNIVSTDDMGTPEDTSDDEIVVETVMALIADDYDVDALTETNIGDLITNYADLEAYLTSDDAKDITIVSNTTSIMTADEDGNITQTTSTPVDAFKIIDYDEEIAAQIASGNDTNGDNYIDADEYVYGDGLIGTYHNDSENIDEYYIDYEYAQYLTPYTFDSVAMVTTASDGKSATVYVSNSGSYLDNSGELYSDWERLTEEVTVYSYVYDNQGNAIVTSSTETINVTVPAVYFDVNPVSLDVFNTLDDPYWLSYSALVENIYDTLDDPREVTE